jgi:hypothetical protein
MTKNTVHMCENIIEAYIASHRESPKVSSMFNLFQCSQSSVHSLAGHIPIVSLKNNNCSQNLCIGQLKSLPLKNSHDQKHVRKI